LHALRLIPIDVLPASLHSLTHFPLVIWLGLLIAAGILRALGLMITQFSSISVTETINTRLKNMAIYSLLMATKKKFLSNSTMQWYYTEVFGRASQSITQIAMALTTLIQISFLGLGLFYLAWKETLVGLTLLGLVALTLKKLNKKVIAISHLAPNEAAIISKGLQRVTQNWIFVRVSGLEFPEYSKISYSLLKYFNSYSRVRLFAGIATVAPNLVGIILITVILAISNSFLKTNASIQLIFLYLFIRFTQQLSTFTNYFTNFLSHIPQLTTVMQFLDEIEENDYIGAKRFDSYLLSVRAINDQENYVKQSTPIQEFDGTLQDRNIVISGLWFKWSEDKDWVFEDFSISIEENSIFGIIGPSGSGKSTFLSLLLGLVEPIEGDVKIGGINAAEYVKNFSSEIGYVGADPFIIDGTIKDNILYGCHAEVDDLKLWQALSFAKISDVVQSLPGKLEYRISEIGEGLSTGQKQRLAIARAMVKDPKLLVLDEATANLDEDTEKTIADSINSIKGKCTVIIVSHKPGMLRNLDAKIILGL